MYIVISNPKRKSIAVGVVHIYISYWLIKYCNEDQFIEDAAAKFNVRSFVNIIYLYMLADWLVRTASETSFNLRRLKRTFHRLHLLFCLIYGHRLPNRPYLYLLPCRNQVIPIRSILRSALRPSSQGVARSANMLLVEMEGIEPSSRILFIQLHTIILLFIVQYLNRSHIDYIG